MKKQRIRQCSWDIKYGREALPWTRGLRDVRLMSLPVLTAAAAAAHLRSLTYHTAVGLLLI